MFIDLVLAKHDGSEHKYLFQAPAFSALTDGDLILVETNSRGNQLARVVSVVTVEENKQDYSFIVMAKGGVKFPLKKVLGKYSYNQYCYPMACDTESGMEG